MTDLRRAAETAKGWIAGHEISDRPCRSFHFSTPELGSIYAFSLTWTPGSLVLAGDLGELVLTHYHALKNFEYGLSWAAGSDVQYLLTKSDKKRAFDKEDSIDYLLEYAREHSPDRFRPLLKRELFLEGMKGAAFLSAAKRELERIFEDRGDERCAKWIYDLAFFDDWYGCYNYTARDAHQIGVIQHGCRLILDSMSTERAA